MIQLALIAAIITVIAIVAVSRLATASLSGVVRCWHSNAYSSLFLRYFLRPTEQICPDSAGPFIVSILSPPQPATTLPRRQAG